MEHPGQKKARHQVISTLKERHNGLALGRICRLFGLTRQAYYQYSWYIEDLGFEHELIIQEVLKIKENHKRMGGRKIFEKLQPFMLAHQIKMGRDAFFDLLSANNLLVRRRKRRISTTNSYHHYRKYPNLIREFIPNRPNQLWVSDITYWKTTFGHAYISFITDAFSRKIVGYQVADNLEAIQSVKALEMALGDLKEAVADLIHHSDRGIQYCSSGYTKMLKDNNIRISMTENGDPLENAIAERINGIIKEEYLDCYEVATMKECRDLLDKVIQLYNEERPHLSLGMMTPNEVHSSNKKQERLWKNYYQKF
jgi:transposase InsO family protein